MSLTINTQFVNQSADNKSFDHNATSTAASLDSSLQIPDQGRSQIVCRCSRPTTPLVGLRTYVYAIDQATTKLRIPLSAVEKTQALEDDGLVPGLCRLFLAGRCRQGFNCFQVHADRRVVEELREEVRREPSCCAEHGARCRLEGFPLGLTVTIDPRRKALPRPPAKTAEDESNGVSGGSSSGSNGDANSSAGQDDKAGNHGTVLSIHSLSPTTYLWRTYREHPSSNVHVPRNKVCRMHRQGLCRFGDECSFLHVCRDIPLDALPGDEDDVHSASPGTPLAFQSAQDKSRLLTPHGSHHVVRPAASLHSHGHFTTGSLHHAPSFANADGDAITTGQRVNLSPAGSQQSLPLLAGSRRSAENLLLQCGRDEVVGVPLLTPAAGANFHSPTTPKRGVTHNPYSLPSSLQ